uniref:Uncharacterized protein n=1 Tax=Setaria italica TaxID=4555 RepID=K4AH00_SETIT
MEILPYLLFHPSLSSSSLVARSSSSLRDALFLAALLCPPAALLRCLVSKLHLAADEELLGHAGKAGGMLAPAPSDEEPPVRASTAASEAWTPGCDGWQFQVRFLPT